MKFAVIAPIDGLERYSGMSNLQMALAHIEDPAYWAYYAERRYKGDTIILDNGSYERGEPDIEKFMNRLNRFSPQIAILPDFLMQEPRKTISESLRFLDNNTPYLHDTEWMFVPQAQPGQLMEVLQSVDVILNDARVGHYVKWIGLGRYLYTHFNGLRPWYAAKIKQAYPHIKIHALGSGSGSIEEFKLLEPFCESMDSSSPVWRGWNGFHMLDTWKDIPVDFNASYDEKQHQLILDNLQLFGVGGGGDVTQPS